MKGECILNCIDYQKKFLHDLCEITESCILAYMDWISWIIFLGSALLACVGLVMTLVNLPGACLVFIAILISAIRDGFQHIPVWLLCVFLGMTILSLVIDNIAMLVGSRSLGGASRWGMLGAVVGGLVGLFIGSIFGLLLGPFVGAVIFELAFAKKNSKAALKSGFAVFVGFLIGIGLKFAITVSMIAIWVSRLFSL